MIHVEALLWRLSLQNGLSWREAQLSWLAQARQELAPRRGSERAGSERSKAEKSRPSRRKG